MIATSTAFFWYLSNSVGLRGPPDPKFKVDRKIAEITKEYQPAIDVDFYTQ